VTMRLEQLNLNFHIRIWILQVQFVLN